MMAGMSPPQTTPIEQQRLMEEITFLEKQIGQLVERRQLKLQELRELVGMTGPPIPLTPEELLFMEQIRKTLNERMP
jgi:hypothetical protein